jgi:hypothetical protein
MKIQYYGGPLDGQLRDENVQASHIGHIIRVSEHGNSPHDYRVCHVREDGTREASYQGIEDQPRPIEQIAGVTR